MGCSKRFCKGSSVPVQEQDCIGSPFVAAQRSRSQHRSDWVMTTLCFGETARPIPVSAIAGQDGIRHVHVPKEVRDETYSSYF